MGRRAWCSTLVEVLPSRVAQPAPSAGAEHDESGVDPRGGLDDGLAGGGHGRGDPRLGVEAEPAGVLGAFGGNLLGGVESRLVQHADVLQFRVAVQFRCAATLSSGWRA